jgi:hypothetical protein
MSARRGAGVLAGMALAVLAAGAAVLQRPEPPRELAWIGLFNGELLGWLENQNRLVQLCGQPDGSVAWHQCEAAHLAPKVAVIPVRAAPRVDAERRGEIVLLATPGRGFRIYASPGRGTAQPFTPDLFDPDWGYGPHHHQTVLARRGSWFRVPLPVLGAGWIRTEDWLAPGESVWLQQVGEGELITTPRGDLYVLGVGDGVLRARPEQPADMWCDFDDPPPLAPWQELRIPFDDLFDAAGHLRIEYKYTRGC